MSQEQPSDNESHILPTPEEIAPTPDPEFAAKVAAELSALNVELVNRNRKAPTVAQINANRENAKKSTGPKSAEGKKRVARNALKHGLTAEIEINTRFEFDGEFTDFQAKMHTQFAPASPEEIALVDRITTLHWRLKRIPLMESKFIGKISEDDSALALQNEAKTLSNLSRYEGQLDRCLHRTLKELKETQAARHAFPYQTRTFVFIDSQTRTPSSCALAQTFSEVPLRAEEEGAGDGGSAVVKTNPISAPHDSRPTVHDSRSDCETNPIPETPSSCALHPDLSHVSLRAEEEGEGDGGSAADETNPIAAQSTSPGTCCGGGSVSEANSGGGVQALEVSSPDTLAPRRERVGPGSIETVPSLKGQGRGEGDPAQIAADKTNPILSHDSHVAQAHPAPSDPAPRFKSDSSDLSDGSSPNAERLTPNAFPSDRQSLIASRDSEAAYYEAINCAMAILNISPYDELNIEELEKLIPEHLRRHTPSSCALHPDLSDVSFRAEEEGAGDGGSAADKTNSISPPHDSRLTVHGPRSAETNPNPTSGDQSDSSDLSDHNALTPQRPNAPPPNPYVS